MDWFKLNTNGILRGSMARSPILSQLVWIKLLALMSETHSRNGRFEFAKNQPYPLDYIATNVGVTKRQLENCLMEFEADVNADTNLPRVSWDNNTLIITNWLTYQSKPTRKKNEHIPLTESSKKAIARGMAREYPNSAYDGIIEANNDVTNKPNNQQARIILGHKPIRK